jgi:hypothetical protein
MSLHWDIRRSFSIPAVIVSHDNNVMGLPIARTVQKMARTRVEVAGRFVDDPVVIALDR